MNFISRLSSRFCGLFALRIIILVIISSQVLAVDRRTPNKAGQQEPQQWYEKGWKTSGSNSDTVFIDDARSQRSRLSEGSGAGGVSDLDDTASGYGEDDEDSEVDGGSGAPGRSRGGFDGGSGDDEVPLPPRPAVVPPRQNEPVVEEGDTSIASWTSTTTTTTTSSAHLLPITTPTTKPSFIGPVAPPELPTTTARPRHHVETTSTTTRVTTSSVFYTMRQTTTTAAGVRHRPTTTTTAAPKTTTIRESHKTSPTSIPPMLDDTNKAVPQNFWMRPGVLAGLIGGAVAGLLAAILLVMFVVYRMRKKDEGSYALEEPKSPPAYTYAYQKAPTREFYA